MYCRYCGAELPDGQDCCGSCGADNAQTKKTNWKPILAVICVIVLAAGIGAAVWFSMNGGGTLTGEDVFVKASYTGTDDQVLASMDTVVAKAGEFELTNGELQVAYWTMVYDFLNYYGDYAAYILDFSTPLDQQYYNEESGVTWQHYFLESAVNSWRRYEVMVTQAEADGVEMSQGLVDHFDTLYQDMEAAVEDYGFDTVAEMVVHDFGVGGTFENYENYMRIYYYGNEYYSHLFEQMELTDADIQAYYANHEQDFIDAGYSKDDGSIVDVRHILIKVGEDTAADYTDAQWADCYAKAEQILGEWLDGAATEESFAELANTYSEDGGSNTAGGLYSGITSTTSFVEPFLTWCMDESRQVGDYGIVQTTYGYHIMYFSNSEALWYEVAVSNLTSERLSEQMAALEEQYPLVVEYSKVVLGGVELA